MIRASLMAQTVKNPPAVEENRVQSLGREGPLEKTVATHSSVLAWRIPWTAQGPQRVGHDVTERIIPSHFHEDLEGTGKSRSGSRPLILRVRLREEPQVQPPGTPPGSTFILWTLAGSPPPLGLCLPYSGGGSGPIVWVKGPGLGVSSPEDSVPGTPRWSLQEATVSPAPRALILEYSLCGVPQCSGFHGDPLQMA